MQGLQPAEEALGQARQVVCTQLQELQSTLPAEDGLGQAGHTVEAQVEPFQGIQTLEDAFGQAGQRVVVQVQGLQGARPAKEVLGQLCQLIAAEVELRKGTQTAEVVLVKGFDARPGKVQTAHGRQMLRSHLRTARYSDDLQQPVLDLRGSVAETPQGGIRARTRNGDGIDTMQG